MALTPGFSVPRPPLLQRVTERQWVSLDAVLAALFFIGATAQLAWSDHHGVHRPHFVVLEIVALGFGTLPITLRRKYPMPVLTTVTAALIVSTLAGPALSGLPVVALPLYTVATHYERRISILTLCVVEALLVVLFAITAVWRAKDGDVTSNMVLAGATWTVGDSIRARRAYVAGLTLQAEQRQWREVERAQQSIAEERLQIARELHDIVAHSLSVIAIQSGVGRHVLDMQPEEARKALEAVEMTSRSALEDLRRVLGVLRRDDTDGPSLVPARGIGDLDQLLEQFRAAGVGVSFRQRGHPTPLPPSMDLTVYRIVQEALTNVTKHAQGASASVDINFESDAVSISIVDEGAPHHGANGSARFGPEEGGSHHGIIGMRERAAVFGGFLTAGPRRGGGFEVQARLPLGPDRQ